MRLRDHWGMLVATAGFLLIVGATVLSILKGGLVLPVGLALAGAVLLIVGRIVIARAAHNWRL